MLKKVIYEWGLQKAETNRRKHGLGFPLATQIFIDRFVEIDVEGEEHGEIRWKAIGQVGRAIIRVTYTAREEEGVEIIRIISARKVTPRERRAYQGAAEDDG